MRGPTDPQRLRAVVVLCQAATLLITWPLWQVRAEPPLLPLFPLPQVSFGCALLGSLALMLWRPFAGVLTHSLLLAAAMVFDQTREQPQVVSMALLLWATLPSRGARTFGALHIAALWLWSGLGKLCSPAFLRDGGAWLVAGHAAPESAIATTAAVAVGAGEVVLALLALWPRTRVTAAWLGAALHLAILAWLSPLGRDVNPSVWPWNIALAVAAPVLLGRSVGSIGSLLADAALAPRLACAALVVLPLGFHAGVVDAAFSQTVYAFSGPRALCLRADGRVEPFSALPELRVFLPPVPRVFVASFTATAGPNDRLVVLEERWPAKVLGAGDLLVHSPARESR